MAKPPPTPPSKDHGSEKETDHVDAPPKAAEQEEVTQRHSSGRPPQAKR